MIRAALAGALASLVTAKATRLHAAEPVHHRVTIDVEACSSTDTEEIVRIASIEIHQPVGKSTPQVASALRVEATCIDEGVRLVVRSPVGADLVERVVAVARDDARARPRVIALAIAEAVALSESSLAESDAATATLTAKPATATSEIEKDVKPVSPTASRVALELSGGARAWFYQPAVHYLGGARVSWDATRALAVTVGAVFEVGTARESLGILRTRGVSGAAGLELFSAGRAVRLATGPLIVGGAAQLAGEPDQASQARGGSVTGAWLGLALAGSLRLRVSDGVALQSRVEAGYAPVGIRGTVGPALRPAWEGAWLGASLGLAQIF